MSFKLGQLLLLSCLTGISSLTFDYFPSPAFSSIVTPNKADEIAPRTGRFQPLPASICNQMQGEITQIVKGKVTSTTAPFTDSISQGKGTGCQLAATATGRNFNSIPQLETALKGILTKQGWVADNKYAASGPEGTQLGFRKGNDLAILNLESALANGVNCQNNVPVATCYQRAKPEQILYRIKLKLARQS